MQASIYMQGTKHNNFKSVDDPRFLYHSSDLENCLTYKQREGMLATILAVVSVQTIVNEAEQAVFCGNII